MNGRCYLKKNEDFSSVYENGTVCHAKSFSVKYIRNNLDYSRWGIVTSKKIGGAVVRNHVTQFRIPLPVIPALLLRTRSRSNERPTPQNIHRPSPPTACTYSPGLLRHTGLVQAVASRPPATPGAFRFLRFLALLPLSPY